MLSSRKQRRRCEEAAAEIGRRRPTVFAANAGEPDQADGLRRRHHRARSARLDILVNNAAANPYAGPHHRHRPAAAATRRSR